MTDVLSEIEDNDFTQYIDRDVRKHKLLVLWRFDPYSPNMDVIAALPDRW